MGHRLMPAWGIKYQMKAYGRDVISKGLVLWIECGPMIAP